MELKTDTNAESDVERVDYTKLASEQAERVAELEARFKEKPADDLTGELDRETDKLRHYENAASGIPHARALFAARQAKKSALGNAIIQPL